MLVYLLLALLLLVLSSMACNGRIGSRRNALPTQEPAPALSAETENLFNDLDSLLNQIDELDNDNLSDLP